LDLREREDVRKFFFEARPQAVIFAAAKVGRIKANYDYPAEFLLENLQIQNNPVSIRNLLSNRFGRNRFCPVPSNRRTRLMLSLSAEKETGIR
jgi:hypothetical protein